MAKEQYTMLDTDLSLAVDAVIALIEEKGDFKERWEDAENKLKHEMDRAKKPEIKHLKGYSFTLDHTPAKIKLKIQKPKNP